MIVGTVGIIVGTVGSIVGTIGGTIGGIVGGMSGLIFGLLGGGYYWNVRKKRKKAKDATPAGGMCPSLCRITLTLTP